VACATAAAPTQLHDIHHYIIALITIITSSYCKLSSLDKCTTSSVTLLVSQAVAASLPTKHATQGAVACATPISSPLFVTAFVQDKAHEATTLLENLTSLPVSSQTKWIICIARCNANLTIKFTASWHHLQYSLRSFEESVASAALRIRHLQPPPPQRVNMAFVNTQLGLPLRQGAFGLDYTISQTATATWLSMAARCNLVLADSPAESVPLPVKAPNLSAFGSASSPKLPASAPRHAQTATSHSRYPAAHGQLPQCGQPCTITSTFHSFPLTSDPGFTASPAERQLHFLIHCPHAIDSHSPTLRLMTAANSALERQALSQTPPTTCCCGARLQGNDATHPSHASA
jgi:hypothetical protein